MCWIIVQGFTEIGQIHQKIFSVVNYSDLFEGKSSTFRDSFLSYAKFVRNCKKVFKCFSAFQCTKNSTGPLLIISQYQLLISHCSGDEYVSTLVFHLFHKLKKDIWLSHSYRNQVLHILMNNLQIRAKQEKSRASLKDINNLKTFAKS